MATRRENSPTPLFIRYVWQLVLRAALFVTGIVLFIVQPEQLDITGHVGIEGGISIANILFVLMLLDLISKFRPRANISMGSKKQYPQFHAPTEALFGGSTRSMRERVRELASQGQQTLGARVSNTRRAMQETTEGIAEAGKQFAVDIDVLRMLPWSEDDLTANEALRHSIRQDRLREIIPVLIFWIVWNVAIGLLLDRFGWLNERTVLLWTMFYFVFDLSSVVLWCPIQLVLMRNRCCTTCQIFNWDGIMATTPLFVVGGWYGWTLLSVALLVLVRWELAFIRHPERFDERTNASLMCKNCKDKLCYIRKPFTPRKLSHSRS
ncbi:MAG: hypothetical protein IKG21_11345 [Atopobiaceae bacterium]|nr:hypothetical protein [Atopobiaceae bacterium]